MLTASLVRRLLWLLGWYLRASNLTPGLADLGGPPPGLRRIRLSLAGQDREQHHAWRGGSEHGPAPGHLPSLLLFANSPRRERHESVSARLPRVWALFRNIRGYAHACSTKLSRQD